MLLGGAVDDQLTRLCLFRIHYSDRYSDDKYEYRHVILPKPLMKYIPKQYYNTDQSGTLRLLSEKEWRAIGITQSYGWEHYEVHSESTRIILGGYNCSYARYPSSSGASCIVVPS